MLKEYHLLFSSPTGYFLPVIFCQRRAKRPEGADQKTMLPRKTPVKIKTFDSCTSPSGQLERLVMRSFNFFLLIMLLLWQMIGNELLPKKLNQLRIE